MSGCTVVGLGVSGRRLADFTRRIGGGLGGDGPSVCLVGGNFGENLERVLAGELGAGRATVVVDAAVLEGGRPETLRAMVDHTGELLLLLSTATAFRADPARRLVDALVRVGAVGAAGAGAVRIALSEALANAVIHGNLEIDSDPRQSIDGFQAFNRRIAARLDTSAYGSRTVTVSATWSAGPLRITVRDQGRGFVAAEAPPVPVAVASKSGRGLALIRQACREVALFDGGRAIAMTFSDP